MNFKDLKAGYSVYLLDKSSLTFTTEKVISISLPHVDAKMVSSNMVVDITTESGTYCMPADISVAYPLNKVISTERSSILLEVQSIKASSEQRINNIERDKNAVSRCNELICELDPSQKEKQAMESRMQFMESKMQTIDANMAKMMSMLEKLAS